MFFLMVVLLIGTACSSSSTIPSTLIQEGYTLSLIENNATTTLFEDVIDYTYDPQSKRLFVLHQERSDEVDPLGYEAAIQEGLAVGGFIRIYDMANLKDSKYYQSHIMVPIYENDFTRINPWSLDGGDFEGDGSLELFLGCFKATAFYSVDRRPFVVQYDGEKIVRKWMGSYIGHDNFLTGEITDRTGDGLDELVLVVQNRQGDLEERVYQWADFRFDYIFTKGLKE